VPQQVRYGPNCRLSEADARIADAIHLKFLRRNTSDVAAHETCYAKAAMTEASPPDSAGRPGAPRSRALPRKAFVFAVIGVLNTAVDYGVFLAARAAYMHMPAAMLAFAWLAGICRCGEPDTLLLIGANVTSWVVAVSGSYLLNSTITFAAESGRKLRWRDYLAFVVSGIVGLVANTATLIGAAQLLLLPVWLAKALAVLASFVVNFTFSHFVVFRPRAER
jgi:putative flippase GtrA